MDEKNEQKQVEEMATLLYNRIATIERFGLTGREICEKLAKEILKYYQPKIPENAVVLTKEEYERLKGE